MLQSRFSYVALALLAAAPFVPAARAQLQPLTWTVTSPQNAARWSDNIAGVTFGNNRFLVAGSYTGIANGARIATSSDLVNWTSLPLPPGIPTTGIGQEYFLTAAAHGNGLFVVGASGRPLSNSQKIITSSDNGATWTFRDVQLADVWGVDYLNGLWVAAGNSNQSGRTNFNVATSPDGITWTLRATGSSDDLNAVAYGNGRYVAVGNNFQAVHSTDGVTWTRNIVNDQDAFSRNMTIHLRDVIFANGRFVAAAEGGRIYTSTDGLTWTTHIVAPTAIRLRGVAYGGGRYVAVGDTTTVSSADGQTWITDTTGLRLAHTVAYANNVFVIGADFGTVYRSGMPTFAGPVITAQPQATSTVAGGTATFSVTATGSGLSYLWKRNGIALPGATSATLTLTGAAVVAGTYTVDITNAEGTTPSAPATLTLVSASNAGRLVNMSIRTSAGTGDDTLIVGLGIGGANTSGSKSVLIRGVGPTLATSFGLSTALADAVMTAFQGQTQIAPAPRRATPRSTTTRSLPAATPSRSPARTTPPASPSPRSTTPRRRTPSPPRPRASSTSPPAPRSAPATTSSSPASPSAARLPFASSSAPPVPPSPTSASAALSPTRASRSQRHQRLRRLERQLVRNRRPQGRLQPRRRLPVPRRRLPRRRRHRRAPARQLHRPDQRREQHHRRRPRRTLRAPLKKVGRVFDPPFLPPCTT